MDGILGFGYGALVGVFSVVPVGLAAEFIVGPGTFTEEAFSDAAYLGAVIGVLQSKVQRKFESSHETDWMLSTN